MRYFRQTQIASSRWLVLLLGLAFVFSSATAQEEDGAEKAPASPEASSPEASSPEASSPEASSPEASSPETSSPETSSPETSSPETSSPEATSFEPTSSEAEPAAETPALPASPTAASGKIVFGKIDGEINLAESAFVKRLLEAAELQEAEVLAIELNTFGGRVDAAVAIRDALLDTPLRTVVFINRRAISAGALISLACEKIAISSGGTIGAATPIVQAPGQEMPQAVGEKYVSYFREEMRSTAETRGRNADIAEAMVDSDKEVEGVSEKGKLLTLSTKSALELGIADIEAESMEDALAKLGIEGGFQVVERSWSENLVSFLTSAAVVTLLGFAMMFLAYMEYQTPGFGGFGFGALACFLLLYFSHYMVNLAGWEELLLFGLGAVLIVVEIFVIPGFGIVGILGIVSIVGSLAMILMAGDWSDLTFTNPFTIDVFFQIGATLLAGVVAIGLMLRFLPTGPTGALSHLVLRQTLAVDEGFQSHEEAETHLVGKTGTTTTALRPAGKARIDGQRLNVETEGDFIDAGEEVRVLRHELGRVVVRRA